MSKIEIKNLTVDYTEKKNRFTAGKEWAEPMHFSSCMIKRGYAKENIILGLFMVILLG